MIRMYRYNGYKYIPVLNPEEGITLVYMSADSFYTALRTAQSSVELDSFIISATNADDYYIVLFKEMDNKNIILEYDNKTDLLHIVVHKTVCLEG